jgi:Flp pilus assembly protein TadB
MTQAEIEAELISQREQLLRMQQQKKDGRRLAQVFGGVALLFIVTGIVMALVSAHTPAPLFAVLLFTAFLLVFIVAALGTITSPR